jgi:hypothetical protein
MGDKKNPLIKHYKKLLWDAVNEDDMGMANVYLVRLGQIQGVI